jgi:surface protein
MQGMFFENTAFNQDISGWDTSSVTTIQQMFYTATSFNQNLSSWDVSNAETCHMFASGATSWTEPKPNFTNCNPN